MTEHITTSHSQVVFIRIPIPGSLSHFSEDEIVLIFTALHGMQTRSSDENSVRLSVRLSVRRVHCDRTEEIYVYIVISYERTFSLVFWEGEWLVGATPST